MDTYLADSVFMRHLENLYGNSPEEVRSATDRFRRLTDTYEELYSGQPALLASAPGRVELCGNHTDHNNGRVLAAAVQLDTIAAASPTTDNVITIRSDGYDAPFRIHVDELDPVRQEEGTTNALIRGTAARFRDFDYSIGGLNAVVMSDVLPGSGLSSSASIEILLGTLFNTLFNNGRIPPAQLAHIGQYAENTFFRKPCGLMDQLTCALGGIVHIDFADPASPLTRTLRSRFDDHDISLLVVHTGATHEDLTAEYAAVPGEMKEVARYFGYDVLRDLPAEPFLRAIPELRTEVGDRAILRALHFFSENERVTELVRALEHDDVDRLLSIMLASGSSSARWLQNCAAPGSVRRQGIMIALALSEWYIHQAGRGATRVHGGGFAGTILTALPKASVPGYVKTMEEVFGDGAVTVLRVRNTGALALATA